MEWSYEELDAAVRAYIKMRDSERSGKHYTKKSIYEELARRFNRTTKSFEYRMQNISYVYSVMGRQWVKGLKPARNVGTNVLSALEDLILKNEGKPDAPTVEFEEEVNKLRKRIAADPPTGSLIPEKQVSSTTTYVRDPGVAAWVLAYSNGVCERCDGSAPFRKIDGSLYLEVHHLRRLADGGSDTISNAIAVCPNCHRELHYGESREEALTQLYGKLRRLRKE